MTVNTFPSGKSVTCALVLVRINLHTKFELPSFTTHSRYDWVQNLKSNLTMTTPFSGMICHQWYINLPTKFEGSIPLVMNNNKNVEN